MKKNQHIMKQDTMNNQDNNEWGGFNSNEDLNKVKEFMTTPQAKASHKRIFDTWNEADEDSSVRTSLAESLIALCTESAEEPSPDAQSEFYSKLIAEITNNKSTPRQDSLRDRLQQFEQIRSGDVSIDTVVRLCRDLDNSLTRPEEKIRALQLKLPAQLKSVLHRTTIDESEGATDRKKWLRYCKALFEEVHPTFASSIANTFKDQDSNANEGVTAIHANLIEQYENHAWVSTNIDNSQLQIVPANDEVKKAQFVARLSPKVAAQLKINKGTDTRNHTMAQLKETALLIEQAMPVKQKDSPHKIRRLGDWKGLTSAASTMDIGNDIPIAAAAAQRRQPGIQCYNCQEYGHFAADCPRSHRREHHHKTPTTRCMVPNCGSTEHTSDQHLAIMATIPNSHSTLTTAAAAHTFPQGVPGPPPGLPPRNPVTCYSCGEIGHISRNCPKRGTPTPKGVITCYVCGKPGHISRHCPNKSGNADNTHQQHRDRRPDDGGYRGIRRNDPCPRCSTPSTPVFCPLRRNCPKWAGCTICHSRDHHTRNCPQKTDEQDQNRLNGRG